MEGSFGLSNWVVGLLVASLLMSDFSSFTTLSIWTSSSCICYWMKSLSCCISVVGASFCLSYIGPLLLYCVKSTCFTPTMPSCSASRKRENVSYCDWLSPNYDRMNDVPQALAALFFLSLLSRLFFTKILVWAFLRSIVFTSFPVDSESIWS